MMREQFAQTQIAGGVERYTFHHQPDEAAMNETVKTIAVVQGAPSATVQEMFRGLVARWRPMVRVAGVIEESHDLPDRKCRAGYLRSIGSGALYPIFQDLGPGMQICTLEARGALSATEAVTTDIAEGCDLVVLSKFGKLEASRQGLIVAFTTAIAAGVPILTSVSPAFAPAWTTFATSLFVSLPADPHRIEAWWRTVRDGRRAA